MFWTLWTKIPCDAAVRVPCRVLLHASATRRAARRGRGQWQRRCPARVTVMTSRYRGRFDLDPRSTAVFNPRDAMLATGISYGRAPTCLSVSVRVTVVRRCCVKTAERIELIFGMQTALGLSCAGCRISVSQKITVAYFPLGVFFFLTLDLEKFRQATFVVAMCHKQAATVGLLLKTHMDDGRS